MRDDENTPLDRALTVLCWLVVVAFVLAVIWGASHGGHA